MSPCYTDLFVVAHFKAPSDASLPTAVSGSCACCVPSSVALALPGSNRWLTCTGCFVLDVHAKHACLKHKVCGHGCVCQIVLGDSWTCMYSTILSVLCVALHLRLHFPRTQNNPILSFQICLCEISCTAFCLRLYLCFGCLCLCVPCNRVVCLSALVCIKVLPESYVSLVVMYVERGPPRAENSLLTHRSHRPHRIYVCACMFVGQHACLIVIVIVIVHVCVYFYVYVYMYVTVYVDVYMYVHV